MAEQKAENDRTIKMLADASEWVPDWKDNHQSKYCPYLDRLDNIIKWDKCLHLQGWPYAYFRTEAEGQAAVEAIGVERVKRLFGDAS